VTGRLVLDAGQLEHTATVPPLQTTGDESQAGLEPGDHVSRDELLQAMLVASANDAARTLAVDVAGNERRFVRMMIVPSVLGARGRGRGRAGRTVNSIRHALGMAIAHRLASCYVPYLSWSMDSTFPAGSLNHAM
jgi:D-alanyl-D-alanine carboxypeptidase